MPAIHYYESPLGRMIMAAEDNTLTGLWFEDQKHLPADTGKWPLKELPVFQQAEQWLDIYFAGKQPDFSVDMKPAGTVFQKAVWDILKQIPYGKTVSYGWIAEEYSRLYGNKRMSAQAVGQAVGHNPISVMIPCHRVTGAHGSLTGYAGGLERKVRLLMLEEADMSRFRKRRIPDKVIILGCPGSGKSTFARRLAEITGLPLYHLDNIWWKPDRSHILREEFDKALLEIMSHDEWIIEGDYSRTYEMRIAACQLAVFLDYPPEVCLEGITARVGTVRDDIPWIEETVDEELVETVGKYRQENRPVLMELFKKYDCDNLVLADRKEADEWLDDLSVKQYL